MLASIALLLACGFGCAVRLPSSPTSPQRAVEARSIGFSILEDYDKGDDLVEVARDFALLRELGIGEWRGSFGWDDYEPSRGQYDFAWLHQFADLAASYGITLRPYIGYTPAWASGGGADREAWNDPPASLEEWARFVETLAREMRRHDNLVSYEIYNEENAAQWWEGDASTYRAVLAGAADAIARADPSAQVLLGGMVFPDIDWLEAVCGDERSAPFDILPFHAYPETWTPPDVSLERYLGRGFGDGFVRAADEACGRKPIWVNETGFATVDGRSERDQAEWWARAIATFAAEPRIEHIGVYELKDLAPSRDAIGGAPNYHLGIMRVDRTRKLAFHTVRMMAALLGAGPVTVEQTGTASGADAADLFQHVFELADGRHLACVWSKRTSRTIDLQLAHRGGRTTELELDGSSAPYPSFDGIAIRGVRLEPGRVRLFVIEP